MSDASFCSDAHRQSYAEEQELAMRRLAESAPALSRTQKLAAIQDDGPFMPESGLPLALGPFPIPGAMIAAADVRPQTVPATVLFRDREPAAAMIGLKQLAGTSPVVLAVSAETGRRPIHPEQIPQMRIAVPRALTSDLKRRGGAAQTELLPVGAFPAPGAATKPFAPDWAPAGEPLWKIPSAEWVPARSLAATTEMVAVQPDDPFLGVLAPAAGLLAMGSAIAYAPPSTGLAVRRERYLRPGRELAPLAHAPIGARPLPIARPEAAAFGDIRFPVSGVAAVPLPDVAEHPSEHPDYWDLFEGSPLGALVLAAQPHMPVPATLLARPAAVMAFPDPSPAVVDPAAPLIRTEPRAPMFPSVTPLEEMPAQEWNCSRSIAGLALQVSALASIPARLTPARPSKLQAERTSLPLPRANAAAGRREPLWDSAWQYRAQDASAPRMPGAPHVARLLYSGGVAVPAMSAPAGRFGAAVSSAWTTPVAAGYYPDTRFAGAAFCPASAGRAPHALRPDARRATGLPGQSPTLETVVRLRMPHHAPTLVSRYGRAECVAVPEPRPEPLAWKRLVSDAESLCPATVLPAPRGVRRPSGLRKISLRQHRVPNAQPMARPATGGPAILGFEEWGGKPLMVASRLRADDGSRRKRDPVQKGLGGRFTDIREQLSVGRLRGVWNKAAHLPSDLKWIAMVVPLVIGIWVLARPSTAETVSFPPPAKKAELKEDRTPDVAEEPPTTTAKVQPVVAAPAPLEPAVPPAPPKAAAVPASAPSGGAWNSFTARIASRASVDLVDDFRNGLSAWEGKGEWARSWSYDKSGTVRPGQMAIFQPSVGLKDYVLEMKASIDRHAIQWMARASNPQNYHFFRLNVTPGAPLTKLELERWTVVNGKAGRVTRMPLPHGGANQTLYAIRVEARGDSITTYLQDQVIDTFNDTRLPDGGVGLVGAGDDRPRVYGIHIFHQNDFLGKLCSFLVPPPINTQGSD